jgi:L,D-transpeptidase catalytic domain
MFHRRLTILVAAGALACVAGGGTASAATTPSALPGNAESLSDERSLTRWAHPQIRGTIFTRPTTAARRIGRLRMLTEDSFPEVYLVLARWTSPRGDHWIRIRIPGRPNGRKGWVRRDALSAFRRVTTLLEIDKRRREAILFRDGRVILRARVGIGAPGTPTPSGRFWIREKFRVIGAPVYGTHALGTSAYAPTLSDWPGGGVVGLHGTNQPGLIPGRPSHGCVRFRNETIAKIFRLVPRGTPLWIH